LVAWWQVNADLAATDPKNHQLTMTAAAFSEMRTDPEAR
jgi:hypothetical protein